MIIESLGHRELLLKPIGSDLFKIPNDNKVTIKIKKEGVLIVDIAKGFITDMGSIPHFFKRFIPYIGNQGVSIAYLVHDALYAKQMVSQKLADKILRDMLKKAGVSGWKVWMVYSALKVRGSAAYEEVTKQDKRNAKLVTIRWPHK